MIDLQCGVVDVVANREGLHRSPALVTVMTAPGQDVRGQCRNPDVTSKRAAPGRPPGQVRDVCSSAPAEDQRQRRESRWTSSDLVRSVRAECRRPRLRHGRGALRGLLAPLLVLLAPPVPGHPRRFVEVQHLDEYDNPGGHQRLVPVSSRFFTAVVAYLEAERPAPTASRGLCARRLKRG